MKANEGTLVFQRMIILFTVVLENLWKVCLVGNERYFGFGYVIKTVSPSNNLKRKSLRRMESNKNSNLCFGLIVSPLLYLLSYFRLKRTGNSNNKQSSKNLSLFHFHHCPIQPSDDMNQMCSACIPATLRQIYWLKRKLFNW